MAITKIRVIHSQLPKRVDYITNPIKTTLSQKLAYTTNPQKTAQFQLNTAINCSSVIHASDDMTETKLRFDKTDGVQAYHIIQSFAPGEVTPEQAHAIGLEFCQRVFENQFEIVVSTHLDKEHIHNHIICNSVSMLTGKKLHLSKGDYFKKIQGISDAICREQNLSVIHPSGRGLHYHCWQLDKQGKLTHRQMLRNDIDLVIGDSYDFSSFLELLHRKGYQISQNPNRTYITVRPAGASRSIRLDRLGEGYTVADIKRRLQQQQLDILSGRKKYQPIPVKHHHMRGQMRQVKKKKITGFYALYLRYVYLLRSYRKPVRRTMSPALRQEVLRLKRYQTQFLYLHKHHITTPEQLHSHMEKLQQEMTMVQEVRSILYARRRRSHNEETRQQLSSTISQQTATLKEKRTELHLCQQIEQQFPTMKQQLHAQIPHRTDREVIHHEHQWRNR